MSKIKFKKIKVKEEVYRYTNTGQFEAREPLLKHPCIHRLGVYRGH